MLNYFARHFQALRNSVNQFSRMPLASIMTCLVIGIALALPSLLYIGLKNLESLANHLEKTIQITLFLQPTIKSTDVNKIVEKLEKETAVLNVQTISPNEGLKELQEQTGLTGTTFSLPKNPLPWAVIVTPKTPAALDQLLPILKNIPQVDSIQMDQLWIKRLTSIMSFVKRFFISISVFLSLGIFLIINNVIRSATQQNQKEIEVIKLIGGTNAFIRRPFLYSGIVYGLLGSILAWQLVDILLLILKEPLSNLTSLYGSSFQLQGLGLYHSLTLLGTGVILGLTASWFAVTRYLKNL